MFHTSIRSISRKLPPVFVLSALLAGCSVGPDYVKPTAPVPAKYKESRDWRPARPRDGAERGAWWSVYRDAELNRLLPLVQVNNQNVAAAVATHDQAEALIREAQASLFPTVSGQYPVTRSGEGAGVLSSGGSGTTTVGTNLNHGFARTLFYPQGSIGWTLDIWGQIRRQIESNVAQAQADSALLANATLSAQAQLAIAYFNLRYEDSLKAVLLRTVKAYRETERITKNQYNGGTVSKADLITAETQVLNTQAQAIATDAPRQQYEHAIAMLTGRPPAEVSVPRGVLPRNPPATPPGLPSTLLERRPDIAAAERTVAEQNALIGVAVAAYYPSITLTAAGGFEGPNAFPFLAAYQIWSLGAAAADPLFDAGLRVGAGGLRQGDLAKFGRHLPPDRADRLPAGRGRARRLARLRQGIAGSGKGARRSGRGGKSLSQPISGGNRRFHHRRRGRGDPARRRGGGAGDRTGAVCRQCDPDRGARRRI